jgi:hypothetical protein
MVSAELMLVMLGGVAPGEVLAAFFTQPTTKSAPKKTVITRVQIVFVMEPPDSKKTIMKCMALKNKCYFNSQGQQNESF